MIRKVRDALKRRRARRLKRLEEDTSYHDEDSRRKFDQDAQRFGGSEPKAPERGGLFG